MRGEIVRFTVAWDDLYPSKRLYRMFDASGHLRLFSYSWVSRNIIGRPSDAR
jgi:hypothetical protein